MTHSLIKFNAEYCILKLNESFNFCETNFFFPNERCSNALLRSTVFQQVV